MLHSVWILGRSNHIRRPLRERSDCIRGEFVQHWRHFLTRLRAVFGQQSNRTRTAFEVHSKYSYCVPTTLSCIRELIHRNVQESFEAGSRRILSIRTAFLQSCKNFRQFEIPARMWREFRKFFIPAGSAWFLLIPNKCDGGFSDKFLVTRNTHVYSQNVYDLPVIKKDIHFQ